MLGKLLKYEFKASSRLFLLLYGALILLSIINSLLMNIGGIEDGNTVLAIIQGIFMFGYIVLIIAVALTTLIVIIIRFYKNLLGDEGYLMFTLPVGADSHILSKLITSIVWGILSTVAVVASIYIVTIKFDSLRVTSEFFESIGNMGFNVPLWITALIVTGIVCLVAVIMMFYAAMAIGPNLTKNRLLGSFLGYIIIYLIGQAVGLISLAIIYAGGFWAELMVYDNAGMTNTQAIEFANSVGVYMFIYINLLNIVTIAINYIITRYFVKNRLNLA